MSLPPDRMLRPATDFEISEILDRLERLPRAGRPLRKKPHLRETLLEMGHESAERHGTPRGEIERILRAHLRGIATWA